MARARRGRRRQEPDDIPVAEPIATVDPIGGGRSSRSVTAPVRGPTGPDFALTVSLGAGIVAALLAFFGVLIYSRVGQKSSPGELLDHGGVQAARMLAIVDIDRWSADFGTTRSVRKRVQLVLDEHIEKLKAGDERDAIKLEEDIAAWRKGNPEEGPEWRPGFDVLFPREDTQDEDMDLARAQGPKRVQQGGAGAFLGAAVINAGEEPVFRYGDPMMTPSRPTSQIGQTSIYSMRLPNGTPVRQYEHPTVNRLGAPAGRAVVTLSAAMAEGPNVMGAAGIAGAGAFLGAFLLAFLLCLRPVRSIQRLAVDTEALARGEFNTKVLHAGPECVKAAAKSVQRLGALAAEGGGGGGGEPQIVMQHVAVLPVEEIVEGLGPAKGFQRPPELEVEATTKPCPDAGNDYHDTLNLPEGRVGFVVADCPVRGVRGALYMAQVRALVRAAAEKSHSPAEILSEVNRAFAKGLPRGVYVTVTFAAVNPETGVCKVASAQHLPLVFWKLAKKGSARLQCEGIALGLDAGPVFDKAIEEKAIQLDKGDRIVLFTDGAITARNAAGATYGEERFYYVINKEAPKNSAAFVNFVANDVDLFHEGSPQLDDFTILTVRRLK